MDYIEASIKLNALTDELMGYAKEYTDARRKYAESKVKLDKMLAVRLPKYFSDRKSMGIESAIIKGLEDRTYQDCDKFGEHYKGMVYYEALYKGYERILDAIESKIMTIQSLMKFAGRNDGGSY